jgi:hypothetical protein
MHTLTTSGYLFDEAAIGDEIVESFPPRITNASLTAFLKWPRELSMEPFLCATPRLLRGGCP